MLRWGGLGQGGEVSTRVWGGGMISRHGELFSIVQHKYISKSSEEILKDHKHYVFRTYPWYFLKTWKFNLMLDFILCRLDERGRCVMGAVITIYHRSELPETDSPASLLLRLRDANQPHFVQTSQPDWSHLHNKTGQDFVTQDSRQENKIENIQHNNINTRSHRLCGAKYF